MIRELDVNEANAIIGGEPRNPDVSPQEAERLAGYGGMSNLNPINWLQQNGYWIPLSPPSPITLPNPYVPMPLPKEPPPPPR